jgi:hypothetical protein
MFNPMLLDSAFVSGTEPSKIVDFRGRMTKFVTFAVGIRRFEGFTLFAKSIQSTGVPELAV